MLFWGMTLGFIGKVLLGVTVMMVHSKITREKRIDGIVLTEMRREQIVAAFAIALMAIGYALELSYLGYLSPLL